MECPTFIGDAISGYITGNDRFGNQMSTTDKTFAVLGSIPFVSFETRAAKEVNIVYRAVDATEANIIKSTGKFSLQKGGVESKYFAKSLEDAHWYGQRLYPNGYTIFQGTIEGPVSKYWYPHIDIGAYVFPSQALPRIIPH